MINKNSVFVVSGGGRGITAHCTIRLAQQYPCHYILLGRTAIDTPLPAWAHLPSDEQKKQVMAEITGRGEKPTPVKVQQVINKVAARQEIEQTIATIEATGAQATYLNVDITDRDALHQALAPYQVTGILHGAGNLADKRIENKTAEDFEYVYAAKVDGLKYLLGSVALAQLEYLILFSSAAGFYGNFGQADYALANEILNKAAHILQHQYPQCRVITLNWGPWDGGMVSPELKKLFAERNMQVIPLDGGAQLLIDEIENGRDVQVLVGSPMTAPPPEPDPRLQTWQIIRTLTREANPFLEHHRIGDHAVLPAVHSVAWMANTCEDLYPGYKFFRCENYRVLKGIVFDDQFVEQYQLELKEVEKNTAQIVFEAKVFSALPNGKPRYHYMARLTIVRDVPVAPRFTEFDLRDTLNMPGADLYYDGTLFHDDYFQRIDRVLSMNEQGITLRCLPTNVPLEAQGQFPAQAFDPIAADIQFQSMVVWGRRMYDAASLPSSAALGETYGTIPTDQPYYVTMRVLSVTETSLKAEMISHDAEGRVYVKMHGAEVTLSQQLNRLFERSTSPRN